MQLKVPILTTGRLKIKPNASQNVDNKLKCIRCNINSKMSQFNKLDENQKLTEHSELGGSGSGAPDTIGGGADVNTLVLSRH